MRILKRIEFGLDIVDPIAMYEDPNYLMDLLVARYENRCYKSCYIEKILRIVPELVTDCNITLNGNPTFGTVGVICDVNAIIYGPGEVINGCTVINRSSAGIIIASTQITRITLDARHPALSSITKDQIISIRVGRCKYVIGSQQIAINAVPYVIEQSYNIYRINGEITNLALFDDVNERIAYEEQEQTRLQKEEPKAWATFNHMISAYKEPQKPIAEVAISIENVMKSQYVSRDPRMDLSSKSMYTYTVDTLPEDANTGGNHILMTKPAEAVYLYLLEDYCAYLRSIREMIAIYSTPELIKSHNNLWLIFKNNKK